MLTLKSARLLGATVLLSGVSTIALAQTQSPTQPAPTTPPAKTEPAPAPSKPSATPTDPARPSATTPARPSTDTSASASKSGNQLIGLAVFSSDGSRLGTVHSVTTAADGTVKTIQLKTGGFLGFGGKMVAVPSGKFTRTGDNVQLGLTSDEVSKLPETKEQG